MLATLDPMGMPLATLVLPGNEADDGLYVPTVIRARHILGQGGHLYVGDSKMSALDTRIFIQAGGDYYLTPMPRTGDIPKLMEELLKPVWNREQSLELIYPEEAHPAEESDDSKPKAIALGYETIRDQKAMLPNQQMGWKERILVVYSPSLARNTRRGLSKRLDSAEEAILSLTPLPGRGKRQQKDLPTLQASAGGILRKHGVTGLLEVSYICQEEQRSIRKYKDRPARIEKSIRYVARVKRNHQAIFETRRTMGWRLYATNTPVQKLPLSKAVRVFRKAPLIERNFARLKGRPLGIHPLYVRREDHTRGLVRLLSLALRVLTLAEYVARKNLKSAGEKLSGLYAGNPRRQTQTPTTERLLEAFGNIHLSIVQFSHHTIRHVTPLSVLQKHVLSLLGLSPLIYEHLGMPFDTS